MTTQVAADLRAAADVLRRDGWTQGDYFTVRENGVCHCAAGAIAAVIAGTSTALPRPITTWYERWERTTAFVDDYLRERGLIGASLSEWTATWNDHETRTADEVIAALEAAADAAEQQAQPQSGDRP